MRPSEALALFLILTILGIASSWMTGPGNVAIAASAWFVAVVYSTVGKRTGLLGNLMVSSCIALPFVYGGVMAGGSALEASLIFAVIAFLANTGREVTKGIVDVEGDRSSGVATVAASRGPQAAAWLSALCYASSVVISLVPVYLSLVSLWYFPFVAFTDVGLLYLSLSLIRDPSRENSRRVKNWVRLLMACGLFGFLAGNLF